MKQRKGFSLIGFLIVVLVIMVLTHMLLKKTVAKGTTKKSQVTQTVQNVRAAVKNAEQTAAQRTNLQRDLYK